MSWVRFPSPAPPSCLSGPCLREAGSRSGVRKLGRDLMLVDGALDAGRRLDPVEELSPLIRREKARHLERLRRRTTGESRTQAHQLPNAKLMGQDILLRAGAASTQGAARERAASGPAAS